MVDFVWRMCSESKALLNRVSQNTTGLVQSSFELSVKVELSPQSNHKSKFKPQDLFLKLLSLS